MNSTDRMIKKMGTVHTWSIIVTSQSHPKTFLYDYFIQTLISTMVYTTIGIVNSHHNCYHNGHHSRSSVYDKIKIMMTLLLLVLTFDISDYFCG